MAYSHSPRIGLWFIGALGGVGSTSALGLAALALGHQEPMGCVTALPQFQEVPFAQWGQFVVGGHDIRTGTFEGSLQEYQQRSNVVDSQLLQRCSELLSVWSQNLRPAVRYKLNSTIATLAGDAEPRQEAASLSEAIALAQADLAAFMKANQLDQVVVVNVASTEPPFDAASVPATWPELKAAISSNSIDLPLSTILAVAALDAGHTYVNATPSTGANLPAVEELAIQRGAPHLGRDLKTGETLLKSVLAPMFLQRNLKVLSWVGHNILGNRDGLVLNDPANKASKLKSKDALLADMLGYKPQSLVSIEYVESLDDWKTAWDHIHFAGFLGTKMTLQFTWQGCDSMLAAPLVLDLARLAVLAKSRGEKGCFTPVASFFKSPNGVAEHDLSKQFELLVHYLAQVN